MIEAEQLQYKLNSFQEPLEDLSGSLALEAKRENRSVRTEYGRTRILG